MCARRAAPRAGRPPRQVEAERHPPPARGRPLSGPGARLLAATAELVDVPSVSHCESELADLVQGRLETVRALEVTRIGDNVVARTRLGRPLRVILAGHLDTVPASGNARSRRVGDELWGVGSADMKGGLAVMLDLAAGVEDPELDVTYVFYVAEEVARQHNGLLQIEAADPGLLRADAAVLGEPTSAVVEAGCQGVLKLEIAVGGQRAHTARPWMGLNALHRLAPVLERLASFPERRPTIEGCRYREALQAVSVSGGVAGNVVPDRAVVVAAHRFAPDRDTQTAIESVRDWLAPVMDAGRGDTVTVVDDSPAAPPNLDHPVLRRLLDASESPARAKLGWTDVAFFSERGVPAANFGPGDPELAHTAAERVRASDLERTRACLASLLTGKPTA